MRAIVSTARTASRSNNDADDDDEELVDNMQCDAGIIVCRSKLDNSGNDDDDDKEDEGMYGDRVLLVGNWTEDTCLAPSSPVAVVSLLFS